MQCLYLEKFDGGCVLYLEKFDKRLFFVLREIQWAVFWYLNAGYGVHFVLREIRGFNVLYLEKFSGWAFSMDFAPII